MSKKVLIVKVFLCLSMGLLLGTLLISCGGGGSGGSTAITLDSIEITSTSSLIAQGSTEQFSATGTFSDGTTQAMTTSVTWSSSDTNVAMISNLAGSAGLATSTRVTVGTTIITATDPASGISGSTMLTVAIKITAGADHTCALLDNGSVKCWGSNFSGSLGLGDQNKRGDAPGEMGDNLPAVDLGAGRTAVAIDAGTNLTCALLDNGAVKCWGDNGFGELGQGDAVDRGKIPGEMGDNLPAIDLGTGRTAMAIAAGANHTCVLLDNGSVKCWGSNFSGELGQGDQTRRGDDFGEMGDNLPAVDLGAGRTAVAIAVGDVNFHSCALLDNGMVKCWGDNGFGQLGQGDTITRGDTPGEMGDNLPAIDLGTGRTAVAIDAGGFHTCALLDNGMVKCWGGAATQGLGDINNRGDDPGEMGDNLPAVDLGAGRTAVAIAAGGIHVCVLLDDASLKCWGDNTSGKLGLGDVVDRGDGPGEMGDNLPAVELGTGRIAMTISPGFNHSCALLDDDSIKCWGENGSGQLGQGDMDNRGDDPGEMGDNLPAVDLGTQ